MRACIHRDTKEIGGTCVELESQGKRIVLDVGLPLDVADPDTFPLHPIKGFDAPDPNLLGVVISHPHQDHYGLAHRLPKEMPFLIGKAAEGILAAADVFTPAGLLLETICSRRTYRPDPAFLSRANFRAARLPRIPGNEARKKGVISRRSI
ncbi:MAG: MBL fold metallo-hydrolase [Tepidisphaeraceae bacterium]